MTHEQDREQDRDYIFYTRGEHMGERLIDILNKIKPGIATKLLRTPAFINGLADALGVTIKNKDI